MGEYLSQPIRVKDMTDGENESVRQLFSFLNSLKIIYGACAVQGWRKKMEDTHIISLNIGDNKSYYLFGVFDGHGGDEVPKYVKNHITDVLCSNKSFKEKKYDIAIKETFLLLDEMLKSDEGKKELFELSHLNSQSQIQEHNNSTKEEDKQLELFKSLFDPRNLENCNIAMFTGCTAAICLIVDNEVYIANAGDSKCIIYHEGSEPIMTHQHRPEMKEEENRIINANGIIEDKKINGIINLSRSIGDLEYKKDIRLKPNKQIIISEPQVIKQPKKDVDYIVIACDGFLEFKSEDKAKKDDKNMKIEQRVLNDIKAKKTNEKYSEIIGKICDVILDSDKDKKDKTDNKDNMTCIVVYIKEEAKIVKVEEPIVIKEIPVPIKEEDKKEIDKLKVVEGIIESELLNNEIKNEEINNKEDKNKDKNGKVTEDDKMKVHIKPIEENKIEEVIKDDSNNTPVDN